MLVRKLIKLSPFVGLTLLNLAALSANAAEGGISGGGGDARTEMRMDAIRADILSWIAQGGAAGLNLPSRLDLETYQQ